MCPSDEVPAPLPSHDPTAFPAGVAWLVIIGAVLAFEIWALVTHHNTLSQYIQHKPRVWRWVAEGLIAILGLHLWGLL